MLIKHMAGDTIHHLCHLNGALVEVRLYSPMAHLFVSGSSNAAPIGRDQTDEPSQTTFSQRHGGTHAHVTATSGFVVSTRAGKETKGHNQALLAYRKESFTYKIL